MSKSPPTAATVGVIDRDYHLPQADQLALQNRYVALAVRRAFQKASPGAARLGSSYVVNIEPFTSWLSSVERRIKDSIVPKEYETTLSTEWLREEVGQAAIRFFQNAADILPGEPFLYASQTGALVAEFNSPRGALTAVISPNAITLFAVKADDPDGPVEMTLRRGAIQLREDVRLSVRALTGPNGQMGTAR